MNDIPHGEAGVEWLKAAFAEQPDIELQHAAALLTIHLDVHSSGLDLLMSRFAMRVCRDFIAAGVACRRPEVEMYAPNVLIQNRWPAQLEQETAELLRLYIRNGYCRMNNQVDAFGCASPTGVFAPGCSNLEAAIRSANIPAAVVFVEEGERLDLVPKMQLKDEPPFGDMLDIARSWLAGLDVAPRLVEASMRHRISVAVEPAVVDVDNCQVRQRRARAV